MMGARMICTVCQAPNDAAARSCIACGQPLGAGQTSPRPGALFAGRYQILAPLGRGGMGMVYKAHDRSLDETVALKVIRPDLARESHLHERFRSEIKLARRIRHKNVCSIFGDGEEQGVLWVCMELVDGVDLRHLVREKGGLPAPAAFDVAIQIAEGLQAIHEVGIIHRDLKTANVMRDGRGVVRLMDFGLAKQWRSEDSTGGTASGHVVGTPDYMSPEQARGEKLSFASDVYSLGVVTFELFTGEPPFRGDTPLTTLLMHLHDPPPLEGPVARRLPQALVPVLRKALAKQPPERFGSAADMAQALRAARAASPDVRDDETPTFLRAASGAGGTLPVAAPLPATDAPAPTEAMPVTAAAPAAGVSQSLSWTRAFALVPARWGWRLAPVAGAALIAVSVISLRQSVKPAPPAAASLPMAAPPATFAPAAPAMMEPAAPASLPPGEKAADAPAVLGISHDPVGCLIAGQFPLIEASVKRPASVARARVYFKSALSAYYFVEMKLQDGKVLGKLPKPKTEASPISYYIDAALADGRGFRTREILALVARSAAECPAGSRVAEIGPPGAVTVFDAKLAMVKLRDALSLEALVSQLKDSDASVRQAAAEALRAVIPSVKAVVEKALVDLQDRDAGMREDAADSLRDVSELVVKEAMIPLVGALKDKNPAVQIKAVESLGEIGPLVASAAKALRATLRDPQPEVRKSATEALATIGSVVGVTLTALEDVPGERGNRDLSKATAAAHRLIEKAGQ